MTAILDSVTEKFMRVILKELYMFLVDWNTNNTGGKSSHNMSNKFLPCIVYNSPYNSPSRGVDYSGGTADHKRASTMPSQGSLFTNFEDIQVRLVIVLYYS